MNKDISKLRNDYTWGDLERAKLEDNPSLQFQTWLNDAIEHKVLEANAMTLSTVKKDQCPTSRIVLLKDITEEGLTFYTNYNSSKGIEIASNNQVAICFFWREIQRQVRIEGIAEKIDFDISEAYFHSRPYASQIGALSSNQSSVVNGREALEDKYKELYAKYEDQQKAPMPDYWGGYLIKPRTFEFWQGRASRLHDRFVYKLEDDASWNISRLEP